MTSNVETAPPAKKRGFMDSMSNLVTSPSTQYQFA